jgi:hypothetical protein
MKKKKKNTFKYFISDKKKTGWVVLHLPRPHLLIYSTCPIAQNCHVTKGTWQSPLTGISIKENQIERLAWRSLWCPVLGVNSKIADAAATSAELWPTS